MEGSGQFHVPVALLPGKGTKYLLRGEFVDLRARLDVLEKTFLPLPGFETGIIQPVA
jgi:hypothetical protein